jgi:hypothetical protein
VAISHGIALKGPSTQKSLSTFHFPSSGHQTWNCTKRSFDSKKSFHFPLSFQWPSDMESHWKVPHSGRWSLNPRAARMSSTWKSRQVAVSHGPHLLDLDGLVGLVDLDDLASYKAVLLAEAARLRFTQQVFFPFFLPSPPLLLLLPRRISRADPAPA